jgi:4-hydroxy-3-methylbut-2-enyl diphosphate reductase
VVVEKAQEAAQLTLRPRVAIVCQTTQQLASLTELVAALLPRVSELRIANTICDATTQRQQASAALARQVQAMVVVGGYDSANTKRLAQICQATGTPTYHVETAEEIQEEWFGGLDAVGLTAGASTPDEVIEAVVTRLMDIGGPQAQVEWLGRPSASQSRGGDQNGHHQL